MIILFEFHSLYINKLYLGNYDDFVMDFVFRYEEHKFDLPIIIHLVWLTPDTLQFRKTGALYLLANSRCGSFYLIIQQFCIQLLIDSEEVKTII